jgi:hypothetical protein
MYDLFQNYVSDLNELRDAFHNELTATAEELSKAMAFYASRSDAAWHHSWRKLRLVARNSKRRRLRGSINFAVFRQPPIFQTPTMDGSRVRQQIRIS